MPDQRIAAGVRTIFGNLLGAKAAELDGGKPFIEMGLDSLMFLQASQLIQNAFRVKVPFRTLLEELSTIDLLAQHLAAQAPEDAAPPAAQPALAPAPPLAQRAAAMAPVADLPSLNVVAAPPLADGNGASPAIERIVARQLDLMSQQLQALRAQSRQKPAAPPAGDLPPVFREQESGRVDRPGEPGHPDVGRDDPPAARKALPATGVPAHIERPSSGPDIPAKPFVPYQPLDARGRERLTAAQEQHLHDLVARITKRLAGSLRIAEDARPLRANSRATAGFRRLWKQLQVPITATAAQGSHLWDVDGNEYVDLTMGFGALLFGHSPGFVVDTLKRQIDRGLQLGADSAAAGAVARLLQELTGVERAAFCNSGTEAVMSALRLARTVTGRQRIAMFEGCYHGTFDGVMVRGGAQRDGQTVAMPLAPGVSPSMIQDVLLLKINDPDALASIRAHGDELAAILVEPFPSRFPNLRPQAFLQQLRDVSRQIGAALVFDELVTGFRLHPGGAQQLFGVQADLVTYGKALGGGLPVAVVAGGAAYMDAIDGGMWRYDDQSYPKAETTFFAGTFFSHPLLLPVVEAVLTEIKARGVSLQQELERRAAHLAGTLNAHFTEQDLPMRVSQFASLFRFDFHPGVAYPDLFYFHMLEQGVYICETRSCFLSAAHTDEDVDRIVSAVQASVAALRDGGFLPSRRALTGRGDPPPPLRDQRRVVPLTEAQQDIWTVCQLGDEASRAYNEATAIHFHGPLAASELCRATADVIARHDALRATVLADGSGQTIHPVIAFDVPLVDLSALDDATRSAAAAERLRHEARHVFDLEAGPLVRACLIRLGPEMHVLALTSHHIAIDAVSKGRLLREISRVYAALLAGTEATLPPAMPFEEYVRQRHDGGDAVDSDDDQYWERRLAGVPLQLNLPCDRVPASRSYAGARVRGRLDPSAAERVRRFSVQQRTTMFLTMLSMWTAVLHTVTRQRDVVVAVAVADQPAGERRSLVGYCLDIVPFCATIENDRSFASLLADVKNAWFEAYEHRRVSLRGLLKRLNPPRDRQRSYPFSAAFNLDKMSAVRFHQGVTATVEENFAGSSKFDVCLSATELDDEIVVELEYNTDVFVESTARGWLDLFLQYVLTAVENPDDALVGTPSPASEQKGPRGTTADLVNDLLAGDRIDQWIDMQAERDPDAVAVVDDVRSLTYRELLRRAETLAAHLRARGVGPEHTVAITAVRSAATLVGMLGVLKAGAAYVPLDCGAPGERIRYVLSVSAAKALLVTDGRVTLPPGISCERLDVDDATQAPSEGIAPLPARALSPDHPAYVIYTSGSTGRPKGVVITHRGLSNYLRWCTTAYPVGEGRGSLVASSLAFDLAVTGLFLPLIVGKAVWFAPESWLAAAPGNAEHTGQSSPTNSLEAMVSVLTQTGGFSLVKLTPAHLEVLASALPAPPGSAAPRSFVIGGEALRAETLEFWRTHAPGTQLFNEYGPTETVVGCCVYRVPADAGAGAVAIGRPIANTELYVLDARLELVLPGAAGELYVGGAGVARGYVNQPDTTAESFLPNPFGSQPGARMYRTGDLVRRRHDGEFEYLGRIDDQVKVHGFRVEPGEVEAVLLQHPQVGEAAVAVSKEPAIALRAYVVATPGAAITTGDLARYLGEKLPAYAVPASIERLDHLPLTPNGKVDRQALLRRPVVDRRSDDPSAAPHGECEERLAAIVAEVLGVSSVSATASFFEMGGDSIQAIRVSAKAKRAGIPITPKQIFDLLTIRALAAPSSAGISPAQSSAGSVPLTPIQRWFFEQEIVDRHHFNQATVVQLPPPVAADALKEACSRVIGHHDALRFRYRKLAIGYEQSCSAPGGDTPFEVIDVAGDAGEADAMIRQHAARIQSSLDLAEGPLVRVVLFRQPLRDRLLVVVHHLAIDFTSWRVLLDDLLQTYHQLRAGEAPVALRKTTSFREWALRLQRLADGGDTLRETAYWHSELAGPDAAIPIDLDGDNLEGTSATVTVDLDELHTSRLLMEMPRQYRVLASEAIITAVGRALRRWSGKTRALVDIEGHGRDADLDGIDLTRTVGWFTALSPFALDGRDEEGELEELRRVRDRLRRLSTRGVSYGLLRYMSEDRSRREGLRRLPSPQVSFNYVGRTEARTAGAASTDVDIRGPMRAPGTRRPYLLDVFAAVAEGRLRMSWTYGAQCHHRSTIESLANDCVREVRTLTQHCSAATVDLAQVANVLGTALR